MRSSIAWVFVVAMSGCASRPLSAGDGGNVAVTDLAASSDLPRLPFDSSPLPGPADFAPLVDTGLAVCPCTRRPSGVAESTCPRGAGQMTTTVIGLAGGTASLTGQQGQFSGVALAIAIPPMSLTANSAIKLTETGMAPPAAYIDWSPVWQLAPIGVNFHVPAKVTAPYSNSNGKVDPALAIYTSMDGMTWTRLSDSQINAGFTTGTLSELPQLMFNGAPRSAANASCP